MNVDHAFRHRVAIAGYGLAHVSSNSSNAAHAASAFGAV
mgnify:CR=1 FL=1